jgi:hypothetical protein
MTDETKGTPLTERLREAGGPEIPVAPYVGSIFREAAAEIDRLTALVATEKERADRAEQERDEARAEANKHVGHTEYWRNRHTDASVARGFQQLRAEAAEAALLSEREQVKELRRGLDEAAKAVPTNWLDPLLIGPDAVLPKDGAYNARHIEALLRGVQDRIRALKDKALG